MGRKLRFGGEDAAYGVVDTEAGMANLKGRLGSELGTCRFWAMTASCD